MLFDRKAVQENIRNKDGKRVFYLGKGHQLKNAISASGHSTVHPQSGSNIARYITVVRIVSNQFFSILSGL